MVIEKKEGEEERKKGTGPGKEKNANGRPRIKEKEAQHSAPEETLLAGCTRQLSALLERGG